MSGWFQAIPRRAVPAAGERTILDASRHLRGVDADPPGGIADNLPGDGATGTHNRNHGSGWQLSGRAPAREGLRGAWPGTATLEREPRSPAGNTRPDFAAHR